MELMTTAPGGDQIFVKRYAAGKWANPWP